MIKGGNEGNMDTLSNCYVNVDEHDISSVIDSLKGRLISGKGAKVKEFEEKY